MGCSPWGRGKSQTRLSNFTFTFHFHALEKELATNSSVLAWRIPGKEEPDGLQSMGSHRLKRLSSSSSRGHLWDGNTLLAQASKEEVELWGPGISGKTSARVDWYLSPRSV